MTKQGLVSPNELSSYIYQAENNTTLASAAQATANTALANAATAQTSVNNLPSNYGLANNNYGQTGPVAMQRWKTMINQIGYAGAVVSTPIRVTVILMGDSTMVGSGISQTDSGLGGAAQLSWPRQVAKIMTAAGVPTQVNCVFGTANISSITASGYASYNTEVSVGGGDNSDWSLANTNPTCLGGYPFRYTNAGSGGFNNAGSTFSFTPANAFDTFTIYYTQKGGTLNANVDGGAALTVATGLGSGGTLVTIPASYSNFAYGSSTYTVSHGTHTINVVIQSGTTTDIIGIQAYDSTISYVEILPMCVYGGKIATFDDTTTFASPAYVTQQMTSGGNAGAPAFIWLNTTVNDIAGGTTAAAYLASMNDLNTKWRTGAPNVGAGFMIGPWTSTMATGGGVLGCAVTQQILASCPTNYWHSSSPSYAFYPTPVIDYASRWSGQQISELMGGDGTHPTMSGCMDIARFVASQLLG